MIDETKLLEFMEARHREARDNSIGIPKEHREYSYLVGKMAIYTLLTELIKAGEFSV